MTAASPQRRREVGQALLDANVGCLLLFVLAFGVPLTGVGVFFVAMGSSTMTEQARLNVDAVAIPARIISSEVRRSTSGGGANSGPRTTSYWADVEFHYERDGVSRTSNRIWPVGEGGDEQTMRAVAQRYPAGDEVTAFVDPTDPDFAFLEKRWSRMPYVSVCIGVVPAAFITALGVLLAGWKRPGLALLVAFVVFAAVAVIVGLAAAHFVRVPPASERAAWVWIVFGGAFVASVAPLVLVIKARRLHRVYRETQAEIDATPSPA